jgi:F-type H+-transporting ATPase subunit b
MPQLVGPDFVPQIVWLLITFLVLYLIMWRVVLPRISEILEERQDRIDDDLERAEKLKTEAEEALATYEKTMADARGEAQAALRKTGDELAAESAASHAELAKRMADQTRAAEARIEEAHKAAVGNIRAVAAEAAAAATAKLIGAKVDETEVEAAIDAVLAGPG